MDQITKNQHYIPRFYLKKFTNSEGRIETLDLKRKKILSTQNVDHICSGDFFYGIEDGKYDEISQAVEKFLNSFENEFAGSYDDLVKNIIDYGKINEELFNKLAVFIALSWLRGKHLKEDLIKANNDIDKQILIMSYRSIKANDPNNEVIKDIVNNKELEDDLLKGNFSISNNNADYLRFLCNPNSIPDFADLFLKKKVAIYIAKGKRHFVTSDNCVVEVFPDPKIPVYGVDIFTRIQYFVLSPNILIEFKGIHNSGKQITRKAIDDEGVTFYNALRSMYSNYLYSSSKDDFIPEEYNKACINNIDKISEIFPSKYLKAKDNIDLLKSLCRELGMYGNDNYSLLQRWNSIKNKFTLN